MGQKSRPWKKKSVGRKKRQKWATIVTHWMRPYYKNPVLVSPWSISNLRHLVPWIASNHLAICVTWPCRLRHFTCSLILFRTLIPYLYPPLRPQMTALGTISSIEKPYEQREERFFRLSMLLKRGKQSTYLCQNPSSRISNGETNKKGNYILFDPKITKYHKNNTDPTPAPLPYMGGDCCAHMYFHWMLGVG